MPSSGVVEEKELAELIRQEVLRSEIAKSLEARDSKTTFGKWVSSFAAHPLILTLVGFLLTGIIGLFIEGRVDRVRSESVARETALERARADEAAARAQILQLNQLVQDRITRARLLRSALHRNSYVEVFVRKELYDDAYFAYNSSYAEVVIGLRQFLPQDCDLQRNTKCSEESIVGASGYESLFAESTRNFLSNADGCLTLAFDEYRRRRSDGEEDESRASQPLESFRCGGDEASLGVNWHNYSDAYLEAAQTCTDSMVEHALRYFRDLRDREEALILEEDDPEPLRQPDIDALRERCATLKFGSE